MSRTRLHPLWSIALPLLVLSALILGPPERRLFSALLASLVCAVVPWLLPEARLRTREYLSHVNLALVLLQIKLVLVPVLLMAVGARNDIFALPASQASMEGAVLIDLVAYVAFCVGLQLRAGYRTPATLPSLLTAFDKIPPAIFVWTFAALGLAGFLFTFGTPARFLEYFLNPAEVLKQEGDASVTEFLGTILRPFLAFSLVTWWARAADQSRGIGRWRPAFFGLVAAVGITIANMTFSFNRGAFVFPLLALAAVYSSRVRRISPVLAAGVLLALMPVLMALGSYRTQVPGAEKPAGSFHDSLLDLSENIEVYAGGPQLTGVFYSQLGWGEHLYFGSSIVSSVLSPIPVLGKGFREGGGPIVYNQAIYGMSGIDDQIPPFASELFANFHIGGVLFGFVGFGVVLATMERWLGTITSTFGAFVIQYIATWGAMMSVWSISVYVQILFYFLGPVYLFGGLAHARTWLSQAAQRNYFYKEELSQ